MSQDPSSTDPLGSAWNFGKLMPGFGFLEQWTKGASAAMPSMGQWVAPTLDPAELEKRIQDLRTVQFWLEQNARMIGMTIQALEVQRMTLDTLKGMNVPVDALRESLKVRTSPAPEPSPAPAAAPESPPSGSTEAGAAIDPMRWWGSLTKQFTDLAANTMQDALKTDGALAGAKKAAKAAKTAGAAKKAPASGRSKAAEAPRAARTRAAAASKTGTAKPGAAGKRPTPASGNATAED